MKKITIIILLFPCIIFAQKFSPKNAIWDQKTNSWIVYNQTIHEATLYRKDGSKLASGKAIAVDYLPDGRPSAFITQGKWKSWYPDGKLFENIEYNEKGLLSGNQIGFHKNGKVLYKRYAENGFYQGKVTVYNEKGLLCGEQEWNHGQLVSINNIEIIDEDLQRPINIPSEARYDHDNQGWVFYDKLTEDFKGWYINGEKMFVGKQTKNKEPYGEGFEWFKNGNLFKETSFSKGKPNGLWKIYSDDGKLSYYEEYKDGELVNKIDLNAPKRPSNIPFAAIWDKDKKIWILNDDSANIKIQYYETGIKESEGKTKLTNDLRIKNGLWKYWKPNGKLEVTITFINGKAEGESYYYDDEGIPIYLFIYKNNVMIKKTLLQKK